MTIFSKLDFPPDMAFVSFDSCDSTMLRAADLSSEYEEDLLLVQSEFQTHGVGQKGNYWESAAGENLCFTLRIRHKNAPASSQFQLLEAAALALCLSLEKEGFVARIKWANDIYLERKKVGGILITNRLCGDFIEESLLGIGLNINQRLFTSDAPNPTSLVLEKESYFERVIILQHFVTSFQRMYADYQAKKYTELHAAYKSRLYIYKEWAWFADCSGKFEGQIIDVETNGLLKVAHRNGIVTQYTFKEIQFLNK